MRQLGIVFSHSDYTQKPHGTERCIREIRQEMLKHDADFIQVFPIKKRILMRFGFETVGVNLGSEFLGIYKLKDIPGLYNQQCTKLNCSKGIVQIQHLLFYNLNTLADVILELQRPIVVGVHDYYMFCPQLNLVDSNGHFCGFEAPAEEKCIACKYKEDGIRHYEAMRDFLSKVRPFLNRIIVPSRVVEQTWSKAFPDYRDLVMLRPHLECAGSTPQPRNHDHDIIKLCYIGLQNANKGFNEWQELTEQLNGACYELHYFGVGKTKLPNVINHYVSISEQGEDAMVQALIHSGIDICLFWPNCPETYSYAFFELLSSGVMVITNSNSGNVMEQVLQFKNGRVFDKKQDMFNYFNDPSSVNEDLNKYREEKNHSDRFVPNRDVSMFLCDEVVISISPEKGRATKRILLTIYYRVAEKTGR